MLQNGKYSGVLVGCGVAEPKTKEGGTPYFYTSWDLRYYLDPQTNEWVQINPETRDVMFSLNNVVSQNSKSGRPAIDFTMEKFQKMGFNGNWSEPEFAQSFYETGTVLIATDSNNKDKNGNPFQEWSMEMFEGGGQREYKPASQSTLASLAGKWQRFATKPAASSGTPAPKPPVAKPASAPIPTASAPTITPPAATETPVAPAVLTTATRDEAWSAFALANSKEEKPETGDALVNKWRQIIVDRYNTPEMQLTGEQWADMILNLGSYFQIPF